MGMSDTNCWCHADENGVGSQKSIQKFSDILSGGKTSTDNTFKLAAVQRNDGGNGASRSVPSHDKETERASAFKHPLPDCFMDRRKRERICSSCVLLNTTEHK